MRLQKLLPIRNLYYICVLQKHHHHTFRGCWPVDDYHGQSTTIIIPSFSHQLSCILLCSPWSNHESRCSPQTHFFSGSLGSLHSSRQYLRCFCPLSITCSKSTCHCKRRKTGMRLHNFLLVALKVSLEPFTVER